MEFRKHRWVMLKYNDHSTPSSNLVISSIAHVQLIRTTIQYFAKNLCFDSTKRAYQQVRLLKKRPLLKRYFKRPTLGGITHSFAWEVQRRSHQFSTFFEIMLLAFVSLAGSFRFSLASALFHRSGGAFGSLGSGPEAYVNFRHLARAGQMTMLFIQHLNSGALLQRSSSSSLTMSTSEGDLTYKLTSSDPGSGVRWNRVAPGNISASSILSPESEGRLTSKIRLCSSSHRSRRNSTR